MFCQQPPLTDPTPNNHPPVQLRDQHDQVSVWPSQGRGWDPSSLPHCALPAFHPSPPPTDSTDSPALLSDLLTSPIAVLRIVTQGITFILPKFVLSFIPSSLCSANCCPQQSRLYAKPPQPTPLLPKVISPALNTCENWACTCS